MQHLIDYIRSELRPRPVTSDQALYEHMESQSNFGLAIVYQPFDATVRWHWADHGRCLDFLESVGGGDLLDIGPGDGWPSLPVAFHARRVTGIDASPRRIAVCEANARRLGLSNFRGVVYPAGGNLPFPDASFDGVMAASAIENAPDPKALLKEIHRVLKPGGRLRIHYEAPSLYVGGKEQTLELWPIDERTTYFYLADRRPAEERVDYYVLLVAAPVAEVRGLVSDLTALKPFVRDAMTYSLSLPGGRTWMAWMKEAGFSTATPTHNGGEYAARLFDQIPPAERPLDLAGVEALLRPGIRVVTGLAAPPESDPMITATK